MMRHALPYFSTAFFLLFVGLMLVVLEAPQLLMPIDAAAHALVRSLQTPLGVPLFFAITFFGTTFGIGVSILLIVVIFRHRPDVILRLLIAIGGATVSDEYLKVYVGRVRPLVLHGLPAIHSGSFPSGHADLSMVFYSYLAVLIYLHTRSRVAHVLAIVLPAVAILLIGLSRLVLQYHYATDVLGGYLLGAFWLAFSLAIPLWYEFYHFNTNHSEPIERPLL